MREINEGEKWKEGREREGGGAGEKGEVRERGGEQE